MTKIIASKDPAFQQKLQLLKFSIRDTIVEVQLMVDSYNYEDMSLKKNIKRLQYFENFKSQLNENIEKLNGL